jgi:hypothetical protein
LQNQKRIFIFEVLLMLTTQKQNKMTTFKQAEETLKSAGFSCSILDRNCSVFKTATKIAYVYFLGLGKGFETTIYDIITEA